MNIRIEFEVKDRDEPEKMTWHEAMEKFPDKDGWRLPTIEELGLMYINKDKLNMSIKYYWASSEYDNSHAYYKYFYNGYQYHEDKHDDYRIRLIRDIEEIKNEN